MEDIYGTNLAAQDTVREVGEDYKSGDDSDEDDFDVSDGVPAARRQGKQYFASMSVYIGVEE